MSGNNENIPEIKIQLDSNGMPILQPEGGNSKILKKGVVKNIIDDDFADDNDIEQAMAGNSPIKSGTEIEQAGRPKLSKSGHTNNISRPAIVVKEETIIEKKEISRPQEINNIGEAAIRHLISSAEKSEQSIKFEIQINAIDKGLFNILNKSYKDKSEQIISIIIESNEEIIRSKINDSIKEYYEIESKKD